MSGTFDKLHINFSAMNEIKSQNIMFKYNLDKYDSLTISNDVNDMFYLDESSTEGPPVGFTHKLITTPNDKKVFNLNDTLYNFNSIYLTKQPGSFYNEGGLSETPNYLEDYPMDLILKGFNNDYSKIIIVQIPIIKVESNDDILNSSENKAIKKIINTDTTESSVKFDELFDLNILIPNIGFNKFTLQNVSDSNTNDELSSKTIEYIFFSKSASKLAISKDNDHLKKLITNSNNYHKPSGDSTGRIIYSPLIPSKSIDIEATISDDIYIDCQPVNDVTHETETYFKNKFNIELPGSAKDIMDKFLQVLFNIIILFGIVFFLFFKLPSYFKNNLRNKSDINSANAYSENSNISNDDSNGSSISSRNSSRNSSRGGGGV